MNAVAAVIVTYNNCTMLAELLTDITMQTKRPDTIIVVDNASTDATAETVRRFPAAVVHERLAQNTGSAGGYHAGMRLALKSKHIDFVWTLDDDVRLDPQSLENLVAGYEMLSRTHTVGAVRSVGTTHPDSTPTEIDMAAWRGSLFHAAVIRDVGFPRPEYFIYGEDLEYSLRMKRKGYRFFWIPSSRCMEVRRGKTDATFLGRKAAVYPSPFRLYYAFRNEIAIYREYNRKLLLLKTIRYAAKACLFFLVTEGLSGRGKIRAALTGMCDGCKGRTGKNAGYAV